MCPNRGNSPKKNQCVKSPQDCLVNANGEYDATLAKAEKEARPKCADNEYFCFKEDTCVAKGVACTPADKCDKSRSFRFISRVRFARLCVCVLGYTCAAFLFARLFFLSLTLCLPPPMPPLSSSRCPSWKCAENKTVCDTDPGKPPACPSGETRCPDAMCYTGSSLKDCTKRGVQWDGCPATKPVRCNSGR